MQGLQGNLKSIQLQILELKERLIIKDWSDVTKAKTANKKLIVFQELFKN